MLRAAKSGKVGLEGKLKNDPTLNIDEPPPNYDPNQIYARGVSTKYILFDCPSVCLVVCPFLSNKRQNG